MCASHFRRVRDAGASKSGCTRVDPNRRRKSPRTTRRLYEGGSGGCFARAGSALGGSLGACQQERNSPRRRTTHGLRRFSGEGGRCWGKSSRSSAPNAAIENLAPRWRPLQCQLNACIENRHSVGWCPLRRRGAHRRKGRARTPYILLYEPQANVRIRSWARILCPTAWTIPPTLAVAAVPSQRAFGLLVIHAGSRRESLGPSRWILPSRVITHE